MQALTRRKHRFWPGELPEAGIITRKHRRLTISMNALSDEHTGKTRL